MPASPEQSSHERHQSLRESARQIGLGPMDQAAVRGQFFLLNQQLDNGITETRDPRLMAIKTRVPLVSAEAWAQVPTGTQTLTAEFGGTNVNVAVAEKQRDGTIALSEKLYSEAIPREARAVTYDAFINRVATPLAEYAPLLGEQPLRFGMSIGLPHRNEQGNQGIEVHLEPKQGGILPKENVILDWETIPQEERGIVAAVGRRITELSPRIEIKTGVGVNDTPGVALDAGAAQRARVEGFHVTADGTVNGTGTNKAVYLTSGEHSGTIIPKADEGLVNTEMGHAEWFETPVSRQMRARLIEKGVLPTEQDIPELEHETGQYLPLRLAAGIELLGQHGIMRITNPGILAKRVETLSELEPALMSKLVTGEMILTGDGILNQTIQQLAQGVMERAAQVYGIMHATTLERKHHVSEKPLASLTEGSTILKGKIDGERTLKAEAEKVAAQLGHPITIYPAAGLAGIAGLTMAYEHMAQKS